MRIIKATEAIPVEHPVFLIFGQPGICKTSLAYSCVDPLLLDYDKGAHRAANRRDTLEINAWRDIVELMASGGILDPYKTIVKDTVGRCLDLITADIAESDPKKAPGGNLSQQGWGVLKNRFRQHVAALRALGKDVLLIAHDKEEKDGDTRIVRPDIVGGSYGEVMKIADFVGYVYMSGKERILDFNPTDRWIGKNPAGWSPFKVPPVGKATDFMAKLFDLGRGALGSISEASAVVTQEVERWRGWIAKYADAADCNKGITDIYDAKLTTILEPQVKKLLADRAAALGCTFDRKAKKFVDPPKKARERESPAEEDDLAGAGQIDPALGF